MCPHNVIGILLNIKIFQHFMYLILTHFNFISNIAHSIKLGKAQHE